MTEAPVHRLYHHFSELPASVRALYTAVLLVFGAAYLFALVLIFHTYSGKDGNPKTLSYEDIVIGYSGTVVSQVLSGKYQGDLQAVRQKVEGALMGLSVGCPVMGEIPRNRCLDYQRQGFAATNPMRVRLAQACPTCPNRRGGNA